MKRAMWLLTLLLVLSVSGTAGAQDAEQKRLREANHLNEGSIDTEKGIAEVRARIRRADALRREAEGYIRKERLQQAAVLLQQSLQIDADSFESMELLADIYITWHRPNDVLQTLRPILYPPSNTSYSDTWDERLRMKYVLALLDTGKWEEAANVYEELMRQQQKSLGKPLTWSIPGYGLDFTHDGVDFQLKAHTLPELHFRADSPDEPALRAQAHLILGSRPPQHVDPTIHQRQHFEYMLDQLQQALKSERRNLDAQFLSGVLLGKLGRFTEARAAFAKAALLAPREAQPEIKDALARIKAYEESKKLYEAQHPAEASQGRSGR